MGSRLAMNLDVSRRPKNARIQIGGSKSLNCRKVPADGSVVIEMVGELVSQNWQYVEKHHPA